MVVTCEISFDNNKHGTFYAGQLVSGCVTLKSDKIKEVQGIYLNSSHAYLITMEHSFSCQSQVSGVLRIGNSNARKTVSSLVINILPITIKMID